MFFERRKNINEDNDKNARVLMHAQRCVKEEAVLIEDGTILDIASECELPHAEQVIDAEG